MSRSARIAAVAACLFILFGCSSSDDSSSSEATEAGGGGSASGEFADELEGACTDGKETVDAATADLSAALSDALEATSAAEFQTAVSEVEAAGEAAATALGDLASSIEALDIPDDAADAVASYTQALADQAEIAQQIAGSDMTSAAAIEDTLAGAQEANRSARRALRAASDELGVSACAPSAADATTTTTAN